MLFILKLLVEICHSFGQFIFGFLYSMHEYCIFGLVDASWMHFRIF
jgi:hypothetical protein